MKNKTVGKIVSVIAVIALICLAFSGCAPTGTATTTTGETSTASSLMSFLPIIVLVVVFYFFLIRPENKKKKKIQEMRNELSVGDKITTIGGMIGEIVSIKDDMITFETGEDRVRIQIAKWGISTRGANTDEKQA